ncbi:hypothetical protein LguiA_001038 [Lonicera macranthoides]
MGAIAYDMETSSSIPAAKFFKAFILDADHLIPKILPQVIKSIETIHGDGGVGTIKLFTFCEGNQYKSVKHRVDAIDEENLTYSYSIIEGDDLSDVVESISYNNKFIPAPDGGSICKNHCIYHMKNEAHIAEEHIKTGKEKATGIFKAVEAYLHANPHEYN